MELSLARHLKKVRAHVVDQQSALQQNNLEHTQLYDEILSNKSQAIQEIYNEMVGSSKSGEVLRVYYDNVNQRNQAISSELIHDVSLCTTQEEVDSLKASPIGMSEIFTKWYRFSHWRGEQNLSGYSGHNMPNNQMSGYEHEATRNAWSYDESTQMIKSNRNSPVYSAFVSDRKLSAYYILVRCDGGGDTDNDGILINLAYMKDSSGVEHTIDLVKARMGAGNAVYLDETGMEYYWSIVYDYRMTTQFELANNTYIQPVSGGWNNNFVYMSAKRLGDKLECYCSQWNSDVIDERSKIEYQLPLEKPSNYSQVMYDNLKTMLQYPAKMGVGAHSQNGLFTIVDQKYIFDDNKIYDLYNQTIWEYNDHDKEWYDIGSTENFLEEGHLYFNKTLQTFYYYDDNQLMKLN